MSDQQPAEGSTQALWRPTAPLEMLQLRARLLARARSFFAARGVLEVDTPMVVNAAVTDVHIHSAHVSFTGKGHAPGLSRDPAGYFLHTSPEHAMKRLLAAGSGDIYQICHVVRALERGRLHNAEFTLIEWYRQGFTLEALMAEVETLVRQLLGSRAHPLATEHISYQEAFHRSLAIDPFTVPMTQLLVLARQHGYQARSSGSGGTGGTGGAGAVGPARPPSKVDRDELLDLLMSVVVGPKLGLGSLTFVHRYPASQAALARIDPEDERAALRFELYCNGVELANGFDELASGPEQRARFAQDNQERGRRGLAHVAPDERFLESLAAGLPQCAGVALGFDRTLMLAAGADRIDDVLPFPIERA